MLHTLKSSEDSYNRTKIIYDEMQSNEDDIRKILSTNVEANRNSDQRMRSFETEEKLKKYKNTPLSFRPFSWPSSI